MKNIKLAAFLALVGSGFYTQSVQASIPFTAGDIFIGFTNGAAPSNDYLVDVGPATTYTTPGSPFQLNTMYIGTAATNNNNLTSVLPDPNGWWGGTNTNWGIIGAPLAGDNQSLMYIGLPRATDATPTTPPGQDSSAAQGGYIGNIQQMENYYHTFGSAIGGTKGTSQTAANSDSWATLSGGAAFGDGNLNNFSNNINGNGDGLSGDVIDLWKTPPSGAGAPIYEGNFAIASTGAITYTPAIAAPEPSTWTALIGGAALLGLIRRRRSVTA